VLNAASPVTDINVSVAAKVLVAVVTVGTDIFLGRLPRLRGWEHIPSEGVGWEMDADFDVVRRRARPNIAGGMPDLPMASRSVLALEADVAGLAALLLDNNQGTRDESQQPVPFAGQNILPVNLRALLELQSQ
jgi:hypothetical protein